MYARCTLPGPSTIDPKVDRAQYEADCLAGRRFPVVTDTVMQERCRSAWRLREWFEIFRRYHLSTMKDVETECRACGAILPNCWTWIRMPSRGASLRHGFNNSARRAMRIANEPSQN